MQRTFEFGVTDLAQWFAALGFEGAPQPVRRRTALGQLVKSMLSGRTLDAVSIAAYDALIARYPAPHLLADVPAEAIEAVVAPVTFAGDKAANIATALAIIGASGPTSTWRSWRSCRSPTRSPGSSACPVSGARCPRRRSTRARWRCR